MTTSNHKEPASLVLRDYGITIAVAVVLALIIRGYVIETYRIPSPSMRPTLEPGDTLFVSKAAYGWRRVSLVPKRGDVIVFSTLNNQKDYIRRVLGLPGEKVEVKQGKLLINDQPAEVISGQGGCGTETVSGFSHPVCYEPPSIENFAPQVVPPQSVFVMGDFRSRLANHSLLDRSWGMVSLDLIKGKAALIWLSVRPGGGWFPQIRFDRMMQEVQ